jgi:4-hydroxybenzoate polyprenyltransferase
MSYQPTPSRAQKRKSGRWAAISLSILSVVGWFTFMPSFPWWAAIAILVDILVIYGLAAHGEELQE